MLILQFTLSSVFLLGALIHPRQLNFANAQSPYLRITLLQIFNDSELMNSDLRSLLRVHLICRWIHHHHQKLELLIRHQLALVFELIKDVIELCWVKLNSLVWESWWDPQHSLFMLGPLLMLILKLDSCLLMTYQLL